MRSLLAILILSCLFAGNYHAQIFTSSNFTLIGKIDPETGFNGGGDKYSGCWGWYQAAKNKEYAIACGQAGTYFVDVTAPATPTVCDYEAGVKSGCTWREVKTYKNFCYVVSDDAGTNSFQIFDMQYLPDSVHKVHDGTSLFQRGHTLWVDSNRLYVSSVTYSNNTYKSLNVYSLANPASPVLLRSLSDDYSFIGTVHDCFVRRDTVFASCGYQGLFVFKFTSQNKFSQIGSLTSYTYAGYNHSSALTPNGKTLVMLDEVPAALPIKVVNVSNLANMQVLSTINQFTATTPHNPFIVDNKYCFVSAYEDGIQLFDISNPSAPFLAGFFDTYPTSGGNTGSWSHNYTGQWGCYPFFPSRNIFALDQSFGIFMLKTHLYQPGSTVGIDDENRGSQFGVYPNPASETLALTLPQELAGQNLTVKVISVSGACVSDLRTDKLVKNRFGHYQVNTSALENGIYILQLLDGETVVSNKKVIIHK